jgi:alanine-glyoxylate transaminase/serine-glyoxylate transaminase/serine-pyruvate transaminase
MASDLADPSSVLPINPPERLLLGPGPSTIHPRVMAAMSAPLVGHMDPYFFRIMDEIQLMLRPVFGTDNPVTLAVPGTGTAAMEAALANLLEPADPVLVCVSGFFGQRLAEVAERQGAQLHILEQDFGKAFTAEEIGAALEAHPAKVVGIVHAETSTGVLQPLAHIADTVHRAGALLLVDAVTSLGGLPVEVDDFGIDVCYSCSQKCLGAPPGFSPITLGPRAQAALRSRKTPPASYYLDMNLLDSYWGPNHPYHHTAPISNAFGLHEALRLVHEEGLAERCGRHRRVAELLWEGLEAMGIELFVPAEFRLPALTTVRVPEGVDDGQVRRRLLEEHNVEIGAGFGNLKGKIWRIGLMGYSCRTESVLLLLAALERILSARVR